MDCSGPDSELAATSLLGVAPVSRPSPKFLGDRLRGHGATAGEAHSLAVVLLRFSSVDSYWPLLLASLCADN